MKIERPCHIEETDGRWGFLIIGANGEHICKAYDEVEAADVCHAINTGRDDIPFPVVDQESYDKFLAYRNGPVLRCKCGTQTPHPRGTNKLVCFSCGESYDIPTHATVSMPRENK